MAITDLMPFRRRRRRGDNVPVRRAAEDPFLRLQEEMNRLFDDFLPDFHRGSEHWPADLGDWEFVPGIDVKESDDHIEVTAELPGVKREDIDVRLDGGNLVIRGQKREASTEKQGTVTHSECRYGSFVRSIPLAAEVDADDVQAAFKDGVLTVTLPKAAAENADEGRIEVKAG